MDVLRANQSAEIAATAARFVVEEGLEYAAAKRRAGRQLGLSARVSWPDNAAMDEAVREYIDIFCPDTQAVELRALREVALLWLGRAAPPRHSDIYIQLFCEDPKAAEWALLDRMVDYHPGTVTGWRGDPVDALSLRVRCEALNGWVLVHLMVHDLDDLRGALKPDGLGRKPRGDAQALRALLSADNTHPDD